MNDPAAPYRTASHSRNGCGTLSCDPHSTSRLLLGCQVARLPPSKEHCFPAGGLIGPLCVSHRNLRKSRMLSKVRLPIMRFWNALIQTRRKGRPLPQVRLPTDGQKAPTENAKHIMGSRTPEMPSLERKGALETHNGRPNNRDRVTERSQVKGCQAYAPAAEHAARWSAYPRNPGGAPQAAGDQHTADGRHVPATGCSRGTPTGRSAERAARPAHRFLGVARQPENRNGGIRSSAPSGPEKRWPRDIPGPTHINAALCRLTG